MKLLIVEDDELTLRLLKKGLSGNGFVVDGCSTGVEGLDLALTQVYDLIVLDVVLPEMDGWEVLSRLRAVDLHTPIIMLTAREAIEHRVRGLDAGADDYLVKPFAMTELIARINAILKRRSATAQDILRFENLELDPKSFTVARGGVDIQLRPKEFLLLELLLRQQGEVISKTYISEHVWDMDFDCDSNVVEVNIRRLRAKIDDAWDRKLITTVRGRGYVIR